MTDSTYQTIGTSALRGRVEADRIAPSLYYDPALFEAELERIFYKTWIWVAHESELPNPGDFRTTTIGRQPVIVVRGKSGSINVLQNRCRHRGATVSVNQRKTHFFLPFLLPFFSADHCTK